MRRREAFDPYPVYTLSTFHEKMKRCQRITYKTKLFYYVEWLDLELNELKISMIGFALAR